MTFFWSDDEFALLRGDFSVPLSPEGGNASTLAPAQGGTFALEGVPRSSASAAGNAWTWKNWLGSNTTNKHMMVLDVASKDCLRSRTEMLASVAPAHDTNAS